MFIKYTLREEFILPADLYTHNLAKAVRNHIFAKYLFKIVTLATSKGPIQVICVIVDNIEILDNIILRKTAQVKVKVIVSITVLRLLEDEYFEGEVSELSQKGIKVKFINGLLEGTIPLDGMHSDTIYNEEDNQWIMMAERQETVGYKWSVGGKVRFRIQSTNFGEQENQDKADYSEMILLKANEAGLGPVEWWV